MITFAKVEHPFPGLRPFKQEESNLFFGREGQSDELLARLSRTCFLAVVGTSGSGKSSLIRAGLLPALHGGLMAGADSSWRVALFRPGNDPFGELARALCDEAVLGSRARDPEVAAAFVETTLRRSSLGLVEAVRQARHVGRDNLLVVVDQFEELFRFKRVARGGDDDAAAFVKLLLEAAAQRDVALYVVITMRSDFLGDCSQFRGLPEVINDAQYLIPRMTLDERREAITGPVAVGGAEITPRLVNRLLNDMGDNPDQLPIMQHAMMRTWEEWDSPSPEHRARHRGPALDLCCYEATGTMERALSLHADEAFAELPKEGTARRTAELMFKALTEKGSDNRETRRPTRLRELSAVAVAGEAEVVEVIKVFRGEGRSFLMPPEPSALAPDTVVDISHESLIRNWGQLRQWVNDEALSARTYRRLVDDAILHRDGTEGLLAGPRLQLALDWRDRHNPNAAWASRYHDQFDPAALFPDEPDPEARHARLFDLAISFLDASRAERDAQAERQREQERHELERTKAFAAQQARSNRNLRRLSAALAVVVILALAAAVIAYLQTQAALASERRAREKENEAYVQRVRAEAYALESRKDYDRAEAEKKRAEAALADAEKARGEALEAKQHAETEAARANEQARLASQRETEARDATQQARDALKTAEDERARALAANERNRLSRDGLAALQRGDDQGALKAFEKVWLMTREEGKIRDGQVRDAEMSKAYGWAMANMGEAQRRIGLPQQAADFYEGALEVFEQTLDPKDPVRFDTYHGLARTYRDYSFHLNFRRADLPQKSEDFYQKALAFLQATPPGNALKRIEVLAELTEFYVELGRPADAKKGYQSILASVDPVFPIARKTLAQAGSYYRSLDEYDEAEKHYLRAIGIEEQRSTCEPGSLSLADLYTELGRVYAARGDAKREDRQRAGDAFEMSRQLLELRQGWASAAGDARLSAVSADYLALGDLLRKMGKPQVAQFSYRCAAPDLPTPGSERQVASNQKLAELYDRDLNDPAQAEAHYRRVIEDLGVGGGAADELATAKLELAEFYLKRADAFPAKLPEVERLLREVEAAPGLYSDSLRLLSAFAELYKRQGRQDQLEAIYREQLQRIGEVFRKEVPSRGDEPDWHDAPAVGELISGLLPGYLESFNALRTALAARGAAVELADLYKQVLESGGPAVEYVQAETYEQLLIGYRDALVGLGRKDEAARVEALIKEVRASRQPKPTQND